MFLDIYVFLLGDLKLYLNETDGKKTIARALTLCCVNQCSATPYIHDRK